MLQIANLREGRFGSFAIKFQSQGHVNESVFAPFTFPQFTPFQLMDV